MNSQNEIFSSVFSTNKTFVLQVQINDDYPILNVTSPKTGDSECHTNMIDSLYDPIF